MFITEVPVTRVSGTGCGDSGSLWIELLQAKENLRGVCKFYLRPCPGGSWGSGSWGLGLAGLGAHGACFTHGPPEPAWVIVHPTPGAWFPPGQPGLR